MNLPHESAYLIRDDSAFCSDLPPEFAQDLRNIVQEFFTIPVIVFSAQEQIDFCRPLIPENCISLDKWFKGGFNLNISRIFSWNTQKQIGHVIDVQGLKEYIKTVEHVNIVDDDSATGSTLRAVLKYVDKPFTFYSLDKLFGFKNVYDIIDVRDFIPGARHGGLMMEGGVRVPYINPLVNLEERMKISDSITFSEKLYELWEKYDLCRNWTFLYKRDILPRILKLSEGD
jgi:hypothetical protein